MRRILLTVAYDGTEYSGYQKQKNPAIITVEGELEKALQKLFSCPTLQCIGASRTDAGVHALGQRVVVDVESTIPTEKIPLAIRSFLQKDIVVCDAIEVPLEFHPQYDCVKKTYEYRFFLGEYRNPLYSRYSEFVHEKLDILHMDKAAHYFIGTHDFQAFCATGGSAKTTVRTIFDCSVEELGDFLLVRVTGNGFLYNMVRILAGTLLYVGLGKIKAEDIPQIIAGCDRTKAGKTLPPQGLTLLQIYYDLAKNP